jgi:GNAT superfamily N-acetyltransferase
MDFIIEKCEYDSGLVEQVRELYESAFPIEEKREFAIILEMLKSNEEILFFCLNEDRTKILAFAIFWKFHFSERYLLDYYAVAPECRSLGIGSEFLQRLLVNPIFQNAEIIFEIENPDYKDKDLSKLKRAQFYGKLGCKVISDFTYFLPSLNDCEPANMILLNYSREAKYNISKNELENICTDLYKNLYRLDDKDTDEIIRKNDLSRDFYRIESRGDRKE